MVVYHTQRLLSANTALKSSNNMSLGVVWSSKKAHMVDAMASGGDEGRANLRKAGVSR